MTEVQVVRHRLDAVPSSWTAALDDVERARAARYVHDIDRDRFVTGVALTKRLVAEAVGRSPAEVVLDRTCPDCGEPHGRPRVPDAPWSSLSVSHAGDWVLAALARVPVGVDVEPVGPHLLEVVDDLWSARERASYGDEAARDVDVVARGWVRKEAVVKALGVGLRMPLADVDVGDDEAVLASSGGRVTVVDVEVDGDHTAAVAAVLAEGAEGYQQGGLEVRLLAADWVHENP